MIAQGGPDNFCYAYKAILPQAAIIKPLYAPHPGILTAMDTRKIGIAVINLGGGRRRAADAIDHSVGFDDILALGMPVDSQTPLTVIHARDEASWQQAAEEYLAALTISDQPPEITPEIYQIITPETAQ